MKPLLTEDKHRQYLESFLKFVRTADPSQIEATRQDITPFVQDSMQIAYDVGYKALAEEYEVKFQKADISVHLLQEQ